MARSQFVIIVFLIIIFFAATPIDSSPANDEKCPSDSRIYGDYCFTQIVLKHRWSIEKVKISHKFASDECAALSMGGLSWSLPKVDSVVKNSDIGRYFQGYAPLKSYIWLGLRRRAGTNDDEDGDGNIEPNEWADMSKWYWTVDNTSLEAMKKEKIDLWETNQPRVGESCALGSDSAGKFVWRSYPCEVVGVDPLEIRTIVCEAKHKKTSAAYEQPWFYVVCALILFAGLIVLLIAIATLHRYRRLKRARDRRQAANKTSSGSARKKSKMSKQESLTSSTMKSGIKKRQFSWYRTPDTERRISLTKSGKATPKSSKATTKSLFDESEMSEMVKYSNLLKATRDPSPKEPTAAAVSEPTGWMAASLPTKMPTTKRNRSHH